MELCVNCHEREVTVSKWALCSPCYSSLYRKGVLPVWLAVPKDVRRSMMLMRLKKKYGPSFVEDMDLLQTKPFWNQVDVAKKYGITKERVRQIYNVLYDEPWRKVKKRKTVAVKQESLSVDAKCNPIRRIVSSPQTPTGVGGVGELAVLAEAEKHGLEAQPSKTRDFDVYISGLPVEVKYSRKIFRPEDSGCVHRGYCRFGTQNEKSKSVFTVFYLGPVGDFYIVPSRLVPDCNTYIRIEGKDRKFSEYRNRWDILRPSSFVDLCGNTA